MADEKSIAHCVGEMREAVLMAHSTVEAFGEALGAADWPSWLWVMQRHVAAITEASEAVELAVNGRREVAQ